LVSEAEVSSLAPYSFPLVRTENDEILGLGCRYIFEGEHHLGADIGIAVSSFESVEVLDAYVDGTLSAIEADFNITRVQVPSLGDEAWWTPVIEDATLLVRVGTRLISFSGDSGMQTVSNDQQKQFGILLLKLVISRLT